MNSPNKSDNQKLRQYIDEIENSLTLSTDGYQYVRTPEFLDELVLACVKKVIADLEEPDAFKVALWAARAEIKVRRLLLTHFTTLDHLILKRYETDEEKFYVRDDSEYPDAGGDGGSKQVD